MSYFIEKERIESVVRHRQVEISGVWLDGWFGCWERSGRRRLRACDRRSAAGRLHVAQ
jgi:hypothetical protein